jgi:hypothetical protein
VKRSVASSNTEWMRPSATGFTRIPPGLRESDPEAKAHLSTFTQGVAELGWADGRNIRMDVRWGSGFITLRSGFFIPPNPAAIGYFGAHLPWRLT